MKWRLIEYFPNSRSFYEYGKIYPNNFLHDEHAMSAKQCSLVKQGSPNDSLWIEPVYEETNHA